MNCIETKDVTFTYPGAAVPAVRDVSFAVEQGEIFGFLGPSGAGKSTTQKILIGLVGGWQGSIDIMGNNPSERKADFYRSIGVSFELPNLHPKLTGRENLDFFKAFYSGKTRKPEELLEKVGLLEWKNMLVEQYSKGMKMRLNFCRALLHDPKLLFLDEPTSGLDPVHAKNIKDIIAEEREKGKTVFLTTHNMFVADQLCDRIALMVDGRLTVINSPEALKQAAGTPEVVVGLAEKKEVRFPLKGIGENKDFLHLIKSDTVVSMNTPQPTLEDIFIQKTGRSLT
jgi:fluoroquinolone transport system ATP-binding protein